MRIIRDESAMGRQDFTLSTSPWRLLPAALRVAAIIHLHVRT